MKELIKKAIIRGIIPFIIMSMISIIMKVQNLDNYQVRSTFIVGIIITSVAAASVIYDIEDWSLIKQYIVHFIIMLLIVFPCLLISNWFKLDSIIDYIKIFGIFIFVGIILWTASYFIFSRIEK